MLGMTCLCAALSKRTVGFYLVVNLDWSEKIWELAYLLNDFALKKIVNTLVAISCKNGDGRRLVAVRHNG